MTLKTLKETQFLVHCPDARQSSAVLAACYLIRKYRYEVADALNDVRELLITSDEAVSRQACLDKVFEYHMQILQNGFAGKGEIGKGGFSALWFPEKPYDFSHDAPYKPKVEDVENMWELR